MICIPNNPTAYSATNIPVSLDVNSIFDVIAVDFECSVHVLSLICLIRATINGDRGNRIE